MEVITLDSNQTSSEASGIFYDSGGPSGPYGNSENYTLTLNISNSDISMVFSQFSTEECCDTMTFWDSESDSNLLGTFKGTPSVPFLVKSTTGVMRIVWSSNGTNPQSGWKASWHSSVKGGPEIVTHPQDSTRTNGQTALFSVTAQNTPASDYSYTWYKNNIVIPGANASTYETPVLTREDNESLYRVKVRNGFIPDALSNIATLTVNPDKPTIELFLKSNDVGLNSYNSTRLSWKTQYATNISISGTNGFLHTTVLQEGTIEVEILELGEVTFTLSAVNEYGTSSESQVVTSIVPIEDISWTLKTASPTSSSYIPPLEGNGLLSYRGKVWMLGGIDRNYETRNLTSAVYSSTDGKNWSRTGFANYGPRSNYSCLVFKDKMWVIGGKDINNDVLSDAWYSSDGINWIQATSNVGGPISGSSCVTYGDRIWLFGGGTGTSKNVRSTLDGVTWNLVTGAAAWDARRDSTAVVYIGLMFLLGGSGESSDLNDVWTSADGINWVLRSTPPWHPRSLLAATTLDNNKIVIGFGWTQDSLWSNAYQDVWYSADGDNWVQAPSNTFFPLQSSALMCLHLGVIYAYLGNPLGYLYKSSNLATWEIAYPKAFPRATNPKTIYFNGKLFSVLDSYDVQGVSFNSNHLWESSDLGATWRCTNSNMPMGKLGESAVTVFKDKIYVIGGKNEAGVNQSAVWASSDGISWNLETADGGFTARRNHAVCVLGDKLIISGGVAGSSTNDVWSSSDGKVWDRIAITSAWSARSGHKMITVRNKLYLFEGVDNASSPLHDSWESVDGGITWTVVNANFLGTYYQVGACNFYGTLAFLGGATANLSEVTGKMYTSLNGGTKEETPIVSGNSIPARQKVTLLVVGPKIYALGGRTLSTLSGLDSVYEGTCPIKSITASPASRVSRGTVDIQWFSLSPDLTITPSLGTVENSVDTKLVDFKKTKRYRIT